MLLLVDLQNIACLVFSESKKLLQFMDTSKAKFKAEDLKQYRYKVSSLYCLQKWICAKKKITLPSMQNTVWKKKKGGESLDKIQM